MYTQNQLDILDAEEYLRFFRTQIKDISSPDVLEWAYVLIHNLESKLVVLYSKE